MKVRIKAPSRIHFGLLGWGPEANRQFGGFGLMINNPSLDITAELSDCDCVEGDFPVSEVYLKLLLQSRLFLSQIELELPTLKLTLHQSSPEHHGLGSGTQRAMSVARLAALFGGMNEITPEILAQISSRFPRSGIGVHGFLNGGLIVDEGHDSGLGNHKSIAPMSNRHHWPLEWKAVLVIPQQSPGLTGSAEQSTFENLPPPTRKSMVELSELLRFAFLPALESRSFTLCMDYLESIQRQVGSWFAPAQKGTIYGTLERDRLVQQMSEFGLRGVGQSSWGPTLFGFYDESDAQADLEKLQSIVSETQKPVRIIQTEANASGHILKIL